MLKPSENKKETQGGIHVKLGVPIPVDHVHHVVIGRRTSLPNGEMFTLKHFATCKTQGVVYLMQCQCGAFYIGKKRQELGKQVEKRMHSMHI